MTCIRHRAPSRHRSMPSQSKPITICLSVGGSRNSGGSWDALVTMCIGIVGNSDVFSGGPNKTNVQFF